MHAVVAIGAVSTLGSPEAVHVFEPNDVVTGVLCVGKK
jgi:hypothetical protein